MRRPKRSWLRAMPAVVLVAAVTVVTAGAQTPPPGTSTTTSAVPAIQQIVEITRTVPAGAPVAAYTVPAGSRLVVTDVIVTNTNATATCGMAIGRGAQASVTGPLCVAARSTLPLPLATGLEFAAGDAVQISNTAETTTDTTVTSTAAGVSVHLRGFLMPGA